MGLYIGIDIGTSGTKTVLFDFNGNTVASNTCGYPMSQPQNGWAEQDPRDWWTAVRTSLRQVISMSGIDASGIKAVGLSGQMHGLVMLDRKDEIQRPAIIWCDQRTGAECAEITDIIGRERLLEITANPALTGFTASKIMWVKKHEPEIFNKTRKILLPKDYIRYMLTGEAATEVSDASGTQLMDIRERRYSGEILDKLGIGRDLLGKMYESFEITGRISKHASLETLLKEGTPVVGGAGDQAAGAVGSGIVKKGAISSTIGTSGVVFAFSDTPVTDKAGRVHTFCHAVPGAWHIMGVTQAAGLSLKWLRDNFFLQEMETAESMKTDPYILMDNMASDIPPGANGLIYLPYLMGERTPHLDPYARGVFFGLSAKHTKTDLLRAVMEGVAYSLRDCLEVIAGMGTDIDGIRASGGGGRSCLWRQIQADVFNKDIFTVNSSEGPALGAAILAMVGSGAYISVQEACAAIVSTGIKQTPMIENHNVYERYYRIYKHLYTDLKDDFAELNKIYNE